MNKTYRNVWNAATNTWTAAAETAKGRIKGSARAARSVLVALALVGAGMGGAFAAEECTTDDGQKGTKDAAGVCTVVPTGTGSIGTMGAIGTTAALDDAMIKINGAATSSATGPGSISIGSGATTSHGSPVAGALVNPAWTGQNLMGTALGNNTTGANGGTAVGDNATTTGFYGVALGAYSSAATHAAAIGTSAMATADSAVAVGTNAQAGGGSSVAVGVGTNVNQANGTAIGANAKILNNGTNLARNAVALGIGASVEATATANADNGVALGNSARVTANNAVALGYGSVADTVNTVSVGSSTIKRKIVNMAAGTADTDAVNLGQMNTALSTKVDNTYLKVGGSGTAADIRGGSVAIGVNAAAGTDAVGTTPTAVAIGASAHAGGTLDVALGANATVNSTGAPGTNARNYSVAVGTSATAVGGGNAVFGHGAQASNGDAKAALNATAIGNGANVSATNAVALGFGSVADAANTVSVGSSTVKRKIVNMDAGTVAAGSTDAVNGGQLYTASSSVADALGGGSTVNPDGSITMPTYTVGDGKGGTVPVSGVGGVVTNLDNRVSTNEGAISDIRDDLASGSLGLVQQDSAGANLTVGKDTDGAAVDFKGTTGARKLINVADGAVAAGSLEAVNGGQLHGVASSVADAIGGGSTVNADGSISKPTFTVGDGAGGTKDVHTVGDVVSNLDGRVTGNEKAIGDIRSELGSGTVGLVQQNATSRNITVAAGTDGTVVDFTNNASAARTLTGVADGKLDPTSKEAVNGSQLDATNKNVAKNTSDITTLNTNVTNLDGRVTTAEGNITTITDKVSKLESGGVGLVQQATPTGDITVAAGTGGTVVNFAGSAGERRLTGVANGVSDTDAVTIAQLKATGLIDYTGKELGALVYDDLTLGMATLGGVGGTIINNLAPGLIAFGSMQAVNGGQLFDMQQDFNNKIGKLDDRVGKIESGIEDGSIGGPGTGTPEGSVPSPGKGDGSTAVGAGSSADGKNSSAIGAGASASKEGSTAVGAGSSASGDKSTAIGAGAQASNNNSVAIGEGSKTTRDNEVSFGSPGNERILGNVAEGKLGTDAVNVNQLNREIGGLRNEIDSNRRDAAGGTATAVALANLPSAALPGDSVMSLAAGTYEGESAMAIGVSTATKDGKWLLKASGSTNTRGSAAVGAGVGFRW